MPYLDTRQDYPLISGYENDSLTREARGALTCQSPPPPHKVWDLLLPDTDHTHYWCKIYCALEVTTKHHMIGLEPLIQPGHESSVHHMVLSYALSLTNSYRWRQTQ